MMFKFKPDDRVTIRRGKYVGYQGIVDYVADKHPLSSKNRYAVRVYGFGEARTLLINEDGLR